MKKFNVGFKYNECYNELIYVKIDDKTYTKESLSDDTITLLTALSYVDEKEMYMLETYENLSLCILGYDVVINGLKEIHDLGFDLIPQYKFRRLVINKNKKKYNGMMR